MNFPVAFLISISMNYATKLSTGCRQICRCRGTRTDRQIWIKLRYLLSYCLFFKRPVLSSLQRRAGSGTDCPTIHFGGWKCPWRVEVSLEGGTVAGGRYCRGRVELSALYLELLVRACRIALSGQNCPPGTTDHPPPLFGGAPRAPFLAALEGGNVLGGSKCRRCAWNCW